jgi:hypothetical protein
LRAEGESRRAETAVHEAVIVVPMCRAARMSDNDFNPMRIPHWKFIFRASAFSALISVLLSGLLFVLIYVRPSGLANAVLAFGAMCMYASIPAGFFGLAAGLLGGGWFSFRRGRIRSTTMLLIEAAAVGIALGLLVPPLESLLEGSDVSSAPVPPNFPLGNNFILFFSLTVGCSTAILFAICFKEGILGAIQKPHSDN